MNSVRTVTFAAGMSRTSAKLAGDDLHRLRAGPGGHLVGGLHSAVSPCGSRQTWVMTGRRVGPLDRHVGLLHGLFGLSLGLGTAFPDVAALEDLGRSFGHRLLLGDDVGQHLVLDLDRADGVARLLLGLGGDCGDIVAVVAQVAPAWQSQDGLHAGHLLGGRGVDRLDLGMCVRAIEQHAEERSLGADVGGVLRLARRLGQAVEPW